ncbi:MAG TPA: arginine N-succinyltransferase [Aeromonadales bacterium]|nr:arginine N-succinyltransferase [Aeromonadales bacterium]
MSIIRPVKTSDLSQLVELSNLAGHGLTTLSSDPERLKQQITLSEQSFKKTVSQPEHEYYLFVLEDSESGDVIGTSALEAAVGMSEPFYTYKVGTNVHSSRKLGIYNPMEILLLGNDYTGTTELCTLFLSPKYRRGLNGRLLSKSRFLFMAQFRERFADRVIAEMRGYSDENGRSPFWDALGSKFFSLSFSEADRISGLGSNQFIAELMPRYPVYVSLLPKAAREVIGRTHPDTFPALKLLKRDGFRYQGYVDIFDAGPTIECYTDNISTIKASQLYRVTISDKATQSTQAYFISNTEKDAFRATLGTLEKVTHDQVLMSQQMADKLNINDADFIRATAI